MYIVAVVFIDYMGKGISPLPCGGNLLSLSGYYALSASKSSKVYNRHYLLSICEMITIM